MHIFTGVPESLKRVRRAALLSASVQSPGACGCQADMRQPCLNQRHSFPPSVSAVHAMLAGALTESVVVPGASMATSWDLKSCSCGQANVNVKEHNKLKALANAPKSCLVAGSVRTMPSSPDCGVPLHTGIRQVKAAAAGNATALLQLID